MSAKKVWIPILIVLLAVVFSGLLYSQKTTNQNAAKIIKTVEAEQSTAPKPPLPGETAESGHWHGDEWPADPHVEVTKPQSQPPPAPIIDAELAAYEASLSHHPIA